MSVFDDLDEINGMRLFMPNGDPSRKLTEFERWLCRRLAHRLVARADELLRRKIIDAHAIHARIMEVASE